MHLNNESDRVKREVLARVARALWHGTPEKLDRIPLEMRPKDGAHSRCCIYKDRAALRYRVMAALGFRAEEETDELKRLAEYASDVPSRTKVAEPFISIMAEGCSACLRRQTIVTNVCRGCLARPCVANCPKKAVSIIDGHAVIDHGKCVNCGVCAAGCSFHAIVQVPLACADSCPVGAVGKNSEGRVVIDHDKCIRCGKCQTACPFGAIMNASQLADVIVRLKSGAEVIAMPAPSIHGIFPNDQKKFNGALISLGFASVYDVSAGADVTTRKEAAELVERLENGAPFMTTSCCPAWMEAVKRVIPEIKEFVSSTLSPMQYTAEMARKEHPDAVLVFIGPCAAKRTEAVEHGAPNFVLTAEELGALFMAAEIDIDSCTDIESVKTGSPDGLGFAVSGGVAGAVKNVLANDSQTYCVNGLNSKTIKLLSAFARSRKAPGKLVEVMCCEGGCAAGPCSFEDSARASKRVEDLCKAAQS